MSLDFEKIEKEFDMNYSRLTGPSNKISISIFYLFVSCEDVLRLLLNDRLRPSALRVIHLVESFIEFSKYLNSVKLALDRVRNNRTSFKDDIRDLKIYSPDSYIKSGKLYASAVEYDHIKTIFYSYHNKHSSFLQNENNNENEVQEIVVNYNRSFIEGYSVLELIASDKGSFYESASSRLVAALGFSSTPEDFEFILSTVNVTNGRINYDYVDIYAYQLQVNFKEGLRKIPNEWEFEWFALIDLKKMINALMAICLYHLVAIELGARKFQVSGGGVDDLLLILDNEELKRRISLLAEVSEEATENFIKILTYGYSVTTPDPALQPLIAIGKRFLLPSYLILFSDFDRNILTLHSRISKKNFDRQSKIFELLMLEKIEQRLVFKSDKIFMNWNNSFNKTVGDFDLLMISIAEKKILLAEAKWSLKPADQREVFNKISDADKKIEQLRKKTSYIRDNLQEFLMKFKLSEENIEKWDVVEVVILDGYCPSVPYGEKPLLMPDVNFVRALNELKSIKKFGDWMLEGKWLPQKGVDYEVDTQVVKGNNVKFLVPAFKVNEPICYWEDTFKKSLRKYLVE